MMAAGRRKGGTGKTTVSDAGEVSEREKLVFMVFFFLLNMEYISLKFMVLWSIKITVEYQVQSAYDESIQSLIHVL